MPRPELFTAVEQVIASEAYQDKKLKLINIGSERVVLKAEGVPGRVFKISRENLEQRVRMALFDQLSSSQDQDRTIIEKQMREWRDEQELEAEAIEIFGKEHFLKRGIFRVTVPVTKDLIIKCFAGTDESGDPVMEMGGADFILDLPDDLVISVKMLAESQEEFDVVADLNKYDPLDFHTKLITARAFFENAETVSVSLDRVRKATDSQVDLLLSTVKGKNEMSMMVEVVENIIRYVRRSGIMVDIFGSENFIIYNRTLFDGGRTHNINSESDSDEYDYKIIELTMPGGKDYWLTTYDKDKKDGFQYLRHYYSFYYFIKTLADKLGIKENLDKEDLTYFYRTSFDEEAQDSLSVDAE